jgi:hypothetical protein
LKILKYIKDDDNYCLVYKTKQYIHYAIKKNNQLYYHLTFNIKNYFKTHKICKKILNSKNISVELKSYDFFYLANEYSNYINNSDYNLILNAYGEDDYVITKIYNKNKELFFFKDINKSPCFIASYIFYLFNCFGEKYHGYLIDDFKPYIKKHDEKIDFLILRYIRYVFYKFINYNLNIKSNFELFQHSDIDFHNKYYFLFFKELDNVIKINKNKILKKFQINNKNELMGYIYYYNAYIYSIYLNYYLNFIDKKDVTISITCCSFHNDFFVEKIKYFMNMNNIHYIKLNFKKNLLLFTDKNFKNYNLLKKE